MEVLAGVLAEGSLAWEHPVQGSHRWILTRLGGTLGATAATRTLSLDSEAWVRVAEVEVEAGTPGGVMEGMEVQGEMMIGIVIVITTEETTEGEAITEVAEVVTANVGEGAGAVAVVGDTDKPSLRVHALLTRPRLLWHLATQCCLLTEHMQYNPVCTEQYVIQLR